jgi:hypothetical protein
MSHITYILKLNKHLHSPLALYNELNFKLIHEMFNMCHEKN